MGAGRANAALVQAVVEHCRQLGLLASYLTSADLAAVREAVPALTPELLLAVSEAPCRRWRRSRAATSSAS